MNTILIHTSLYTFSLSLSLYRHPKLLYQRFLWTGVLVSHVLKIVFGWVAKIYLYVLSLSLSFISHLLCLHHILFMIYVTSTKKGEDVFLFTLNYFIIWYCGGNGSQVYDSKTFQMIEDLTDYKNDIILAMEYCGKYIWTWRSKVCSLYDPEVCLRRKINES